MYNHPLTVALLAREHQRRLLSEARHSHLRQLAQRSANEQTTPGRPRGPSRLINLASREIGRSYSATTTQ